MTCEEEKSKSHTRTFPISLIPLAVLYRLLEIKILDQYVHEPCSFIKDHIDQMTTLFFRKAISLDMVCSEVACIKQS